MFESECRACPPSIEGLQGAELFTVRSVCGSKLKTDQAAQDSLETEVIGKYGEYLGTGASDAAFSALGAAARELLLSMDAVTYKYTTPNAVVFKGVINALADTWLLLDTGLPQGATVWTMIPKEVGALLPPASHNEVLGVVWRRGLYTSEDFGPFICPAVELAVHSGGRPFPLTSLARGVQILIKPNGYLPKVRVGGVFWDGANWAQGGVATAARDETAYLTTSHLSTFTLLLDLQAGVLLREAHNLEILYLFVGVFCGCFFLLFIAALVYDLYGRAQGVDFYLHERELAKLIMSRHRGADGTAHPETEGGAGAGCCGAGGAGVTNRFFGILVKYSLFYNLHLVSIFSYRDRAISSTAKTAWLFAQLCLCYAGGLLVFHQGRLVSGSSTATIWTLGVFLGLLFVPNSFMVFMLTERPKTTERYFVTKDEADTPRAGDATDRQLRGGEGAGGSLGRPVVTHIVRRKRSCRGVVFFSLLVVIFFALAVVASVLLAEALLFKDPAPFYNALWVVLAAFLFGWGYCVVKAVLAALVAVQFRRLETDRRVAQPMGVQVFVDERTAMVHEEFGVVLDYEGGIPHSHAPDPKVAPDLQPYYPKHKHKDVIPEEESSEGLQSLGRNDERDHPAGGADFSRKLHQTSHFLPPTNRVNDDASDFPEATEVRSVHRSAVYPPRSPGLRSSQSRRPHHHHR